MLCTVYRLRRDGIRCSWNDASDGLSRGTLMVLKELPLSGMPCFHATLVEVSAGEEPPPLHNPKLYRADKHGLFLKGYETGPSHQVIRQTWLVVPVIHPT